MGKLVLGKLFSNVFPEQVWSACGISKIKGVQCGPRVAGDTGVDTHLFWAWVHFGVLLLI